MESWIAIAEQFGLPVIMLLGMSWSGIQLFKWLANDLMKKIAENHTRIENIIIRLIDNSNNDDGKSILTKSNKDRSHILDIMDMSITFRMKGAR